MTNICKMLAEKTRDLLGLSPDVKINDDDVHTMLRLISGVQKGVTQRSTATPKKPHQAPLESQTQQGAFQ
jgi:hypothetical protein